MELKAGNAIINYVDHVNQEDTSQTVPIFRIPAGAYVVALGGRVKTAFAGVTFPTVKVGVTGETEKFVRKQPIGQTGDLIQGWAPNAQTYCEAMGGYVKAEEIRSVVATFESASGNFSSLSAGEIEFFLVYAD